MSPRSRPHARTTRPDRATRPAAPWTRAAGAIARPARAAVGAAALTAALAALCPGVDGLAAVAAQGVSPEVVLLRLHDEYEGARLSCQGAVRARKAHQPEYDALIQQAGRVDPESEAWRSVQSTLLQKSQVIDAAQERVSEVCGEAEEARLAYVDGLDAVRSDLESELQAAESPVRRENIEALLVDVDNRYGELQEERVDLALQLVMRPVIDIDPRNTPDDVRRKASLLENLIAMADSTLVTLDEEIGRLQARLEGQQRRESFRANLTRYDDTRTPVRADPGGDEPPGGVSPDSTALSGLTLDERIEALRSARLHLEFYSDRMRERLGEFRAYLRRTS